MSFKNLKKSSNLSKLTKELEKLNTSSFEGNNGDDNHWKLTVDKAGNGHAIIRFLPAPDGEDIPWARRWDHGFQGPGGWYIENSLTTLNKKDPVSEHNSKLWNSGIDSDKEIARKQKRRLKYFSNIYVVEDPANPENNGKVLLFQYGKKIFDKISEAMSPEFEGDEAFDPFHFWEGANFKLRARKVAGFRNYDNSLFASPAPLSDDDNELEEVWKKCFSLQEILDPKHFKSYDELKTKMIQVLGLGDGDETDSGFDFEDEDKGKTKSEPSFPKAETSQQEDKEEEDESLSYFSKLAEDV